jgi:hypothetical protein
MRMLSFLLLTFATLGLLACEQPTSMLDKTSPYYNRPCTTDWAVKYKTALKADCRCLNNQVAISGIDECKRPYFVFETLRKNIAEGPSFAGLYNAEFGGGFLEDHEDGSGTLYVAAKWNYREDMQGAILAVDLKTGQRRIISGVGEEVRGEGPAFGHLTDVRRGPDGAMYAFSDRYNPGEMAIYRIDEATGDRSIIWEGRNGDYPQCEIGEDDVVQYTDSGFAIGPQGQFYIGVSNPTQGSGIVEVAADGSSCKILTFSGDASVARGEGFQMRGFVMGYTVHDGKLWAFTSGEKTFFSVDLATGDRGDAVEIDPWTLGERWAAWDDSRQLFWTSGMMNGTWAAAYDPADKSFLTVYQGGVDWMPKGVEGPFKINSLNFGGVWVKKNGNLLFAHDSYAIVEVEVFSGNSIVLSF